MSAHDFFEGFGILASGLIALIILLAMGCWVIDFVDRVKSYRRGEYLERRVQELEAELARAKEGGAYRSPAAEAAQ